jgi:hypothetical protein
MTGWQKFRSVAKSTQSAAVASPGLCPKLVVTDSERIESRR